MLNRITLLTAAVATLTASVALGAEIKLGGGGASIATIFNPVKGPFQKATGNNLIILQSTPKDGLKQLWKGEIEVAVSAVPLEGMIAGAVKDGVNVDKGALQVAEVGTNKTVLLVHPSNPVKDLSKEQIKGLFTGRIVNWKDVGGSDAPVLVVWGKNSPGQNALFSKVILDGEKVVSENLETTDYKGILETVAANPEAIGIDPQGMVDPTVKAIKLDPPADSPIILVTKGKPSAEVQKLIDFVKGDGKKYVK